MAARKEILSDGYFFDVTDFIEKHPGGHVIEYYTEKGEDSTIAIQQFHARSIEKIKVMMSSLKKRPALDSEIGLDAAVLEKNRRLTEDVTKLYLELEREGYFEGSYLQAFIRTMEVVVTAAFGYVLFLSHNVAVSFIGIVLIGIAEGRCGFLTHELGHYSFTGHTKVDRVLHSIYYGLGVGLSATRWRRQHNRHHAMPQRLHHDVDLETMPILAYNAKTVKNSKDGKAFMVQNQAYLFVLDTLLVGLIWKLYQDPRYILKQRIYLEMAMVFLHWFFVYQIGFWPFLLKTWVTALFSFGNFSLNHTFMPVTTEPTHWFEYSLLHTANVEHVPWCDWMMGYLNYQIEHHIFPTIPNFRLPYIKDRVRALAEKHNIPYVINSYPDAWRNLFRNLSNVAEELKYK